MKGAADLDSEVLAKAAAAKSILIEPGRINFGRKNPPRNYFRLAFSSIDEKKIAQGVKLLAETINDARVIVRPITRRGRPCLCLLAIGLASTQDAIVKAMSGTYPVYETMLIRGFTWHCRYWACGWHIPTGLRTLITPLWPRILVRALILCSAYLAFILSIAAMPMANTVAIYFTMPFFVAGLAGPFFGERVPYYRWIAIIAGFAGVIVMVRPGVQAFEPASLLALYSAFGYAIGQMMGRELAQQVAPLVIANWQNAVYFIFAAVVGLIAQASGFAGEEPQEPGLSYAAFGLAHACRISCC